MPSQHSSASSGTAGELNGWLRAYFRSPALAAKEIRRLLEEDQGQFYAHAVRVIRTFEDSPGTRYLVTLMLERGLLMPAFCEAIVPEQRVLEVMKVLLREDPANDALLAKAVVTLARNKNVHGTTRALVRVLNHLERLTEAKRIAPRLLPLFRHQDPHLRSKVVRIMGKCVRNAQWVERMLADPDARTRANAVEALWEFADDESRALLKQAAGDASNRVAGNALFGLYRAGDASAITELVKMAGHGQSQLRATAAWAMGQSGDPRFTDALKTLEGDADASVRSWAARSLKRVETDAAGAESHPAWRMAILCDSPLRRWDRRQLRVAVQTEDGSDPPPLLSTQFSIFEDERPVLDYRVESLKVADKLAIALLIPAMPDDSEQVILTAAKRVVGWKRRQDAWSILRYRPPRRWTLKATLIGEIIEIAPPDAVRGTSETAVFAERRQSVFEMLDQPAEAMRNSVWDALIDGWRACSGAAAGGMSPHLVIYSPFDAGLPPEAHAELLDGLGPATPVHCISRTANPFFKGLCGCAKGSYQEVADDDGVIGALERLHLELVARYAISYSGVPRAATGCIHVRTPEGCASATIGLRPTDLD